MADELLKPEDIPPLFEALADRMYRYAWGLHADPDMARDLVQTAFLRVLEKSRAGRVQRATAEQYLVRTIRNLAIDTLRRHGREKALDLGDEIPARSGGPTEGELRKIHVLVQEATVDATVPEDVRAVIRMRFVEERDVTDMIGELGRSRSAVYRLMERAVKLLAERFRAAGFSVEDLH